MKALTRRPPAVRRPADDLSGRRSGGVSIATVSRVLRGTAPVAETTRARVLAAVDELRYTPSRLGRSLAEGQHAANGIVFPDLSGPYFAEVLLGYEEVAAELGRSVLILSTHGRQAAREMVLDLAARVDGLVVLGRTVDDGVLEALARTNLPLVLLARDDIAASTRSPPRTSRARARSSATSSPTTAIATSPSSATPARRRTPPSAGTGFGTGCAITASATTGSCPARSTRQAAGGRPTSVLRKATRPRGLVCANDEIALGAITAAEELGLDVPERHRHHRLGRRDGGPPFATRPDHGAPAHAPARRPGCTPACTNGSLATPATRVTKCCPRNSSSGRAAGITRGGSVRSQMRSMRDASTRRRVTHPGCDSVRRRCGRHRADRLRSRLGHTAATRKSPRT